jgi:NADPH:quinone reductase-like Zn-dependent oxidoreductase
LNREATIGNNLLILKPGGKIISISGPPDPEFAKEIEASWYLKLIIKFLREHKDINYVRSPPLSSWGIIRPVIDKVFPFEGTNEALAYIESGRAKGKVVVQVRR